MLFTSTTFLHENLIMGHTYKYRIRTRNLMGYGSYSSTFSFVPRTLPSKPISAPRDLPLLTTQSVLHVEFDAVVDNGGDEISEYLVYIDDGLDQDNFSPYSAGTSLTFSTQDATDSGSLVLVSGRIYKVKYSATNDAGEGPLSDEVSIILADEPDAPENLRRINIDSLPAGSIAVQWDLPLSNGFNDINGYVVYLDDVLHFNSSQTNFFQYTFEALTVGRTHKINVMARN